MILKFKICFVSISNMKTFNNPVKTRFKIARGIVNKTQSNFVAIEVFILFYFILLSNINY